MNDQPHAPTGGFLDVFTKTVSIAGHYFIPLWSISAIFALPTFLFFDLLLSFVEIYWPNTDFGSIVAWSGLFCELIVLYFCSFLIVAEVSDVCQGGTASISKGITRTSIIGAARLFGTNMLVWALMVIAFAVIPVVVSILLGMVAELAHTTMEPSGIALVMIGIGAATLIMIPFLFTNQVVVIERLYWMSALRRSALLVIRSKAVSFVIAMLFFGLFAASYVTNDLLTYGAIVLPFTTAEVSDTPVNLGGIIAASVVTAALIPIGNIFLTVAYYYLKRRADVDRDAATG